MNCNKICLIITLIFFSNAVNSQNLLQGEASLELEKAAKETAERWTVELAMSAKQTALMEAKLVEYGLKRKALVNSKMREEVKMQRFLELRDAENKSMQDILTQPQYRQYLLILGQDPQHASGPHKKKAPNKKD